MYHWRIFRWHLFDWQQSHANKLTYQTFPRPEEVESRVTELREATQLKLSRAMTEGATGYTPVFSSRGYYLPCVAAKCFALDARAQKAADLRLTRRTNLVGIISVRYSVSKPCMY